VRLTDVFIRRPVLAVVVNLVIIIAGLQAIRTLTVRQFPKNENASITINTVYVGADAELVRGFITVPLERAIAAAAGIDYIQSTSRRGLSTISARLELNYDATRALAEIGSKVDQVRGDLPPEAEVPTINIETADSRFAAAYLSFDSDALQQNEITDYIIRVVQPRLAAVPGVQRADVLGARNFAMRAWLDPARMAALSVSPSDVRRALAANNALSAVGQTKGALIQVNLAANTNLQSVEEFRDLVVRERDGVLVRLRDIADVSLGAEDYGADVRFSGKLATFIGIWALPTANTIDVIRLVRTEIDALQRDLPKGMSGRVAYDSTKYIENALDEVQKTLAETLLIVIVVIFLFLGSLRSVLVPLVAIPVSLIGAVFLMQIFGFTINLLTLLAVVLSVGLVVDDAIVMVENVERNLRRGLAPLDAALTGARELVGPIVAMTITLAAVYAPIGLQGGLTGSLFREFAFTLAGAVLISGVVALTPSQVMSSRLLRPRGDARGLPRLIHLGFERIRRGYAALLRRALDARPAIYVVWAGLSILAVLMYRQAPTELAPVEDQGVIFGILDTPSNATLEVTSAAAEAVNDIFFSVKEAAYSFQLTFPDSGFGGVVLSPWNERERTVFEVQREMEPKFAALPSVKMLPVIPPSLPGGGQFPVEFVVAGTAEPREILELVEKLQVKAAASGMFAFPPVIDTKIDQPLSRIELDRDRVASMGLDLQTIGSDLAAMVGGNYVNRFDIGGRSYKVIPQIKRVERLNPEQLRDIRVTGPNGTLIPLSSVATISRDVQPRALARFQQLNAVTLSGVNIRPLDQTLRCLEDEAKKLLPSGYVMDYTGESRQLREQGSTFLFTLGLAFVLIYLVLAAQFNSFRDPLVILAGSVPLAMFGALIPTFIKMPGPIPYWTDVWSTSLNIYSQVGLVTLVGLVSKNGILIVEFANVLQGQGKSKVDAVYEAAQVRLRPVLMTTTATVLGHFPLTLVTGAGAAARNSIGRVLVSGMAIGSLFTLFCVPALYVLFARDHSKEPR
jgi:multidrug efflux pump